MDTSAAGIRFDGNGVCNFCRDYETALTNVVHEDPSVKERRLREMLEQVKRDGKGKPYDCIIGVSGGVDSSWVLAKAVEFGMRPLAVHMDNGWNSELAQNNISNLVSALKVDLYTYVIDWPEYRSLMQAFFDADVIDVELLYDNAMLKVNYDQAAKHGIKYIMSGSNTATEGIDGPQNWSWFKLDRKNIQSIGRKFQGIKIKNFPAIGSIEYAYQKYVKKTGWVRFLDYLPYNKNEALETLEKDYGYKRYLYKHYESIFTRFYQGYLLPEKFGVDKRKMHFSTLIMSGQTSRAEAVAALEQIPYASVVEMQADITYFLKKMGWSQSDLSAYIARPGIPHDRYPSEREMWEQLLDARRLVPKAWLDRLRPKT